jgi:hypothetical protein
MARAVDRPAVRASRRGAAPDSLRDIWTPSRAALALLAAAVTAALPLLRVAFRDWLDLSAF